MCVALCTVATALWSCDEDETYADQKEKERKAIAGFLNRNLTLLDATAQVTDLWGNAGDDTLEGIYFRLLREKLEQADESTRADLTLAAKLSRQILQGREVELP